MAFLPKQSYSQTTFSMIFLIRKEKHTYLVCFPKQSNSQTMKLHEKKNRKYHTCEHILALFPIKSIFRDIYRLRFSRNKQKRKAYQYFQQQKDQGDKDTITQLKVFSVLGELKKTGLGYLPGRHLPPPNNDIEGNIDELYTNAFALHKFEHIQNHDNEYAENIQGVNSF